MLSLALRSIRMPRCRLPTSTSTSTGLCYRLASTWSSVPLGPPDAILGITEAFKRDVDPLKMNLGVGAYRDDNGKPWVLPCVKEAEGRVVASYKEKEYAPITGVADFTRASAKLAYGAEAKVIADEQIAITQSISGTGALRIGGEFLARFYGHGERSIYLPNPSWGNHKPIFKDAGLEVKSYRYFDKATNGLDLAGVLEDMEAAPEKSVFLLHACAHNPTGVDPTATEWARISEVMAGKGHLAFFDMAYQGFASGYPEKDAFALRHFVEAGHPVMLAQSFAKNLGLYGERTGAFSIVCASVEERKAVESQIKIIVRPMYSNPPIHGARLVATILNDAALHAQWLTEVKVMADRIIAMRGQLSDALGALGSQHPWSHITSQIGMFCYTGLTPEQVDRLRDEYHIYMTRDGRVSMAGVTTKNVQHLAAGMHAVTK